MQPLSPGHLFQRGMEGREEGIETRVPEWAQVSFRSTRKSLSLSLSSTHSPSQLHILELKTTLSPQRKHRAMGKESGQVVGNVSSDQIPA